MPPWGQNSCRAALWFWLPQLAASFIWDAIPCRPLAHNGQDPTGGEVKVCFRLLHIPIIRFCLGTHYRPKDMRIAFLQKPSVELGL
jgi:hypothetical protein